MRTSAREPLRPESPRDFFWGRQGPLMSPVPAAFGNGRTVDGLRSSRLAISTRESSPDQGSQSRRHSGRRSCNEATRRESRVGLGAPQLIRKAQPPPEAPIWKNRSGLL